MRFLEAYAGLTDEALTELASAGLLRRARKLSDDVAVAGSDAKGADLTIGGHAVRVDARGPAAVACECPTGGVCVHVVVACRWAAREAAAQGCAPAAAPDAPAAPAGPAAPAVAATGPGQDGASAGSAAGPAEAGEPEGAAGRATAPGDSGRAGTPATRSAAPAKRSAKRSAVAKRQEVALAEVRDVVVHLLDGGLAHLRDDTPESLRALAGRARVAAFEPVQGLRLDALLRTAAGQAADLAAHDDSVSEADLLGTLTEIWALAETHEAGAPETVAPTGQGRPRSRSGRQEDETDIARLVPLGVRWWTSASGARGIAVATWDPEAARVRTAVTGRPAGGDPSFRREWDVPLLWGSSPARLSGGPFALAGVRERTDGTLGAGGNPRLTALGEFGIDELREIAGRTGAATPAREVVGFGRRPAHVRLLLVRDQGDVGIDEVRQDLTWTVTDSTGQRHLLRVPVEDRRTTDTLLHVLAGRWTVVGVTAERHADRLEPAGVFVRGDDGVIRLISPSITHHYQIGTGSRWSQHHWDTWRKRLGKVSRMRSRARAVTEAAEPDPPVVRACALAWEVSVAMAATGRRRLTARQLSDVTQARTLARDLGLTTLESALTTLVPGVAGEAGPRAEVSPEALARAAFLIRRTREVTSAGG